MNKKGLSTIVASVIIIFLTILAIMVIAQFAIPFVKNNLTKSTECLNYREYFEFDESLSYNCMNGTGVNAEYIFSVKARGERSLSSEIKGFVIVLRKEGASDPLNIYDGSAVNSEVKMFNVSEQTYRIPINGETYTYRYKNGDSFNEAEIYPVLKSGRTCESRNDLQVIKRCEI